jgi:hypothetical protein
MTATTMVALAFITLTGLLLVVMIFGSLTRKKWALVTCRGCGAKVPMFQWPTSINQLLRGGWTCPVCGYQVDRWGRPI